MPPPVQYDGGGWYNMTAAVVQYDGGGGTI